MKISFFEKNFWKKFSKSGISPKLSSNPNLASYYIKPRALGGLIFSVTRFHIYPEYVWRSNTLQNFQLAPWGGLKSPPRDQNSGQNWQKGAPSQIEHLIT